MDLTKILSSGTRFGRQEESFDHDREQYFETLANMLVSSRVDVRASDKIPTAACKFDEDSGSHSILLREGEMHVADKVLAKTSMNENYTGLLCKEGMLYHELGHVLFTSHAAWKDVNNSIDLMSREELGDLMNIMEDAVIEAYLIEQFGIGRMLALKNENKHRTIGVFSGSDDPTELDQYFGKDLSPVDIAAITFEEMGRFELGIIETHLDDSNDKTLSVPTTVETVIGMNATEVISRTVDCLRECVQEPRARQRYEAVKELFIDIYPDGAPNHGDNIDRQSLALDVEEEPTGSDQQRGEYRIQTPDMDSDESDSDGESGDGGGDSEDSADSDEQSDNGSEAIEVGESGDKESASGDEKAEEEAAENGSESGSESANGEEDDDSEIGDPGIAQSELSQDEAEQAQEESEVIDEDEVDDEGEAAGDGQGKLNNPFGSDGDADAGDLPDELEQAFNLAGAGDADIEVRTQPLREPDAEQVIESERIARSIEPIVKDYLHQKRKTRNKRNQLQGKFDDGQLINAERGSPRVFEQKNKPEELDYHAVLLCDESGSMNSTDNAGKSRIKRAATALTGLARGFEAAGIDVDAYRFGNSVNLVKTAEEPVDDVEDLLLDPIKGGTTNMAPGLEQIEERSDLHNKQSFAVVVTDGLPNDVDHCKEIINRIDMPMLSIQIEQETNDFDGAYDALENVSGSDNVASAVRSVVRRTVFK